MAKPVRSFARSPIAWASIGALLAAAASLLEGWMAYGLHGSLYMLGFGFGPVVRSLHEGHGLCLQSDPPGDCATRPPVLPLFLAAVAAVHDSPLLAAAIKNGVLGAGTAMVLAPLAERFLDHVRGMNRMTRALWFTALCLTTIANPQFWLSALEITYEEGCTVWLIAISFVAIVRPGSLSRLGIAGASACMGLLAVTKSSALPLALVLAMLFAVREWRDGSRKAALWPAGAVLVSVLAWTLHNGLVTDRFSPGTSLDGYNFWKGNNSAVLDVYPAHSLDELVSEGKLEMPDAPMSEWSFDDYAWGHGWAFVRRHPLQAMWMDAYKMRAYFLDLHESMRGKAERSTIGRVKALVQTPTMAATRAFFLIAVAWAVRQVARCFRAGGDGKPRHGGADLAAIAFLLLVVFAAMPCILGFAYVRHFMPLVLPSWTFVAIAVTQDRPCDETRANAMPELLRIP